jgi:hypothetical protein
MDMPNFDEIMRRITAPIVPPRLPGVPDVPIQAEFDKANPLSPEEAKALNWPINEPIDLTEGYNSIAAIRAICTFNPRRN